jgi:hypothetical protein
VESVVALSAIPVMLPPGRDNPSTSVRHSLGDDFGAKNATGAAAIVDNDRLTQTRA